MILGGLGDFRFSTNKRQDTGAFVLAGREAAGLCPVSIKEERMKILEEKKKYLPKLSKPEWVDWYSGGNDVETCSSRGLPMTI